MSARRLKSALPKLITPAFMALAWIAVVQSQGWIFRIIAHDFETHDAEIAAAWIQDDSAQGEVPEDAAPPSHSEDDLEDCEGDDTFASNGAASAEEVPAECSTLVLAPDRPLESFELGTLHRPPEA